MERHIKSGRHRGSGHKQDLFGTIDQIAVRPATATVGGEILAVQTCGTDWSPHWHKMTTGSGRAGALLWLSSGSPLLLLGWRQLKSGWTPRIHWWLPEDILLGCDMDRHRDRDEWERRIV